MKFYILKNASEQYFYNCKNFLDSPNFGEFKLSSVALLEEIHLAEVLKSNLENTLNETISIIELSVEMTPITYHS